ncbi:MAG: hypothetical protein OEZ16_04365 [Chromatiales bacterium]|nr:hypothetical protein [Chromatiales bacterium]
MSVDLSKLSAKELFELAQKKEQEEKSDAERQDKINELKEKLESLVGEHKNVLMLTDKKIRDMQEQREKLIKDHEKALADLETEIKALGGAAPKSASSSGDDLRSTLRQIMNKRPYISGSLLKEQLATRGIKFTNFNKDLEKWVKDGWLEAKGQGNYALGKRA